MKVTSSVVTDAAVAEKQVKDGALDAYVGSDTIFVEDPLDAKLGPLLQFAHQQSTMQALLKDKVDEATVAQASTVARLPTTALVPTDPRTGERKGIAFLGSILLFAQLIG